MYILYIIATYLASYKNNLKCSMSILLSIPIIVLTEPDHEPYDTDAEEEVDTKVAKNKQNEDNSDVPEIAVSPPSPRPERKDNTMANNISLHSTNALDDDLENNDSENLDDEEDLSDSGGVSMPMIKITIESPVESLSSPSESPNEHKQQQQQQRKKPPPISIPNSNFHNDQGDNSQNISKDAMSKPVTPSTSCHVIVTNWGK